GRNLQMWPRAQSEAQDRAYEVLDMLGLARQAGAKADHLAHGDKPDLEIARTTALQPHVLLLDEPTADTPPGETGRMGELIRCTTKHASVLLVEECMEIVLVVSDEINF